jgi:hypothetical protein
LTYSSKACGTVELGGPLAVVALVLRQDAGAADALGQLRAVHLLDGLELEEPGAGGSRTAMMF